MKVAAIQAAPVYLDPAATTEKALSRMREAARNGAGLCAFSETFLAGYPLWLRPLISTIDEGLQKACYAAYVEAAVAADGPELAAIAREARSLGIFTYLGFVERASSGGAVYCSLAAIHPDEGIVGVHRKIKPTYFERMVWAEGDGNGLCVHAWKDLRVGGLNCFENWLPLARQTLYAQGEQLHVAVWPGRKTHSVDIARFIAQEGRLYVLSAHGVISKDDIPESFPLKGHPLDTGLASMTGGSMIVAPDGEVLEGPAAQEETILYAEISPRRVVEERFKMDPAGHYGRPDIFRLEVDPERRSHLHPTNA